VCPSASSLDHLRHPSRWMLHGWQFGDKRKGERVSGRSGISRPPSPAARKERLLHRLHERGDVRRHDDQVVLPPVEVDDVIGQSRLLLEPSFWNTLMAAT